MNDVRDRLFDLLPLVHQERDTKHGDTLRALLRVIGEQATVVETDVGRLYENWFIETCEDWLVPYIGDLVGYRAVHEAGEPGDVRTLRDRARNAILIPRRAVAKTLHDRRRKGALALLEEIARDVAGWPTRAVEFYRLAACTQHVDHVRLDRGRTVDLRNADALERIDGAFDSAAHTVDVREIASDVSPGRYDLPNVGLFVWRLKSYTVTRTPAYCLDDRPHCYTFSIVGNDTPLFARALPETDPAHVAEEHNLPAPIRRRRFERQVGDFYGASFEIWADGKLVPAQAIVAADLDQWRYHPRRGQVAVDPERGRIAFPPGGGPREREVEVTYRYGFSADIGGGSYSRERTPLPPVVYRVGPGEIPSITEAVARWKAEKPKEPGTRHHVVIEITDSGLYEEEFDFALDENEHLEIRAADGVRPVLAVSNARRGIADVLRVRGRTASRFTIDGLLVIGGAIQVVGPKAGLRDADPQAVPDAGADLGEIRIRHSTLVPGWMLGCDCEPLEPAKPSLELWFTAARVVIEHSIMGSIDVIQDEVTVEPLRIHLSDSILDATSRGREAIDAPGFPVAHAVLSLLRTTVIGRVSVHAIELAESCIFDGPVMVARRQHGCMRFCYVPPGSRTPRRFACQPDTAVERAQRDARRRAATAGEAPPSDAEVRSRVEMRVRPVFESTRYGTPTYGRLALTCASEIVRGAEDESEMGAFHDLYEPQRLANLRARLDEYTPAGMDAGIIIIT